MKIAILTGWYPNQVIDEDGLSVRNQAKALKDSGLNIAVVSVSLMRQYFSKGIFFPSFRKTYYRGLPQYALEGFHPSRNGRLLFEHYNRQVFKPFEAYVKDNRYPDLIHVHNYTVGYAALQIKKKHGIPFVVTEHSTSFMDGWVPQAHKPYIEEIFEEAEQVFGVSHALAKAMQKYCNKTVQVMPNFIDTALFKTAQLNQSLSKPPSLISISTFNKRKQVDHLIKSMPKILETYPDLELKIVGYGEEEKALRLLVSQMNLTKNIAFSGPASQDEVARYLQESDLFVSASRTETFGVVYVEALACGVPVVALDSGGVRDMVEDGVNGFIVEKEEDLSDKIVEALNQYHVFVKDEIVTSCKKKFGIRNNVKKHKDLYKSIIYPT